MRQKIGKGKRGDDWRVRMLKGPGAATHLGHPEETGCVLHKHGRCRRATMSVGEMRSNCRSDGRRRAADGRFEPKG